MASIFHKALVKKEKVKWSRYRSGVAQRVGRCIALLFHDRGTRRRWVVSSKPRPHFIHPGKTRYPLYRRLGGPKGRSGRAENLVLTEIRSRTVQCVAQSLYQLSYPAHTHTHTHTHTHRHTHTYIYMLLNQREYEGRTEILETRKVFWSENMEGREHFFNVCVQAMLLIKFSVWK